MSSLPSRARRAKAYATTLEPVHQWDSTARIGYTFGQQRRASAQFSFERGSFYGGRKVSFGASRGRVNVSSRLSFEPTYAFNRVTLPEDAFTSHLAGTRITYTMTPLMFASGLLQFRSDGRLVSTNARLRWEYRPGSELFFVFNEERDTFGRRFPALRNRAIIFKLNRLFPVLDTFNGHDRDNRSTFHGKAARRRHPSWRRSS